MQTGAFFLLMLSGIALGFGGCAWLTARAYLLICQARAIVNRDQLALEGARMAKEITGSNNFDLLPVDLQGRVEKYVIEVETQVHKQL